MTLLRCLSSSNGDLSLFQEGNVKDELQNLQKWIELTDVLNDESNGSPKTLKAWKEVQSLRLVFVVCIT